MSPEYALKLLTVHYGSELSPNEAKQILRHYYEERQPLPNPRGHATEHLLLEALTVLSVASMHSHHENDPKRKDRREGQKRRKNRTGSRRG